MCPPYSQTHLAVTPDAHAFVAVDRVDPHVRAIRKSISRYIDLTRLQQLVAVGGNLQDAVTAEANTTPAEVQALLRAFSALLQPQPRQQITCPADVAGYLMTEMGWLEQEQFRVVVLDTKQRVLSVVMVYQGTIESAHIRIAEVFKTAIRQSARCIILAHNHPSGDLTPSAEDIAVTRDIRSAGELLGIDVLDHVIVGRGTWTSLRERRMGFNS